LGRFFKILDCFGQALAMTRGRFRYCVPQAIVICLMLVNFPRRALCLSVLVAGKLSELGFLGLKILAGLKAQASPIFQTAGLQRISPGCRPS
jgi:hypothetical protein